jgi:hypothetical protein
VPDGTIRGAHSEASDVELVAAAIPIFGSFVHKLVERWEDVVSKLHLVRVCVCACARKRVSKCVCVCV